MKTGNIFSVIAIAMAITCFALTSCDWLSGKNNTGNKLIGKWVVVNIADSTKDSSAGTGIITMLMQGGDSASLTVEFRPDSSLMLLNDTGRYYIDASINTLIVQVDSTDNEYAIKNFTDSSMQLFSTTDSVMYTLKKQ